MPQQETEGIRIAKLAESAALLASRIDLRRVPNGHIFAAFDQAGITDLGERRRLLGKVRAAMHRSAATDRGRASSERTQYPDEKDQDIPLSKRVDIIEDARRAEANHPEDSDE